MKKTLFAAASLLALSAAHADPQTATIILNGDKLKPQDVTPAQLLDGAIKKGATANVCALYLPNSGNTPDKLKDGITPAKPDAMARTVLEAQRKVLVF